MEGLKMEKISQTIVQTIEPELIAQRCPVCNGFGTLRYGQKVCQACDGKGYVLIPVRMEGEKYGYEGKMG
jgi:DnaJ-class molecular chaperone